MAWPLMGCRSAQSVLAEHFREPDHPKGCWALDTIWGEADDSTRMERLYRAAILEFLRNLGRMSRLFGVPARRTPTWLRIFEGRVSEMRQPGKGSVVRASLARCDLACQGGLQ
jgi:hypothetical protein